MKIAKVLQVLGVILAFTCFMSSPALAQTQFGWTATNSDAVNTTIGKVPAGAYKAGKNGTPSVPDDSLYACRGEYQGSVQPGKVWKSWCHIGWGGKEVLLDEYEVLVTAPGKMTLSWLPSGTGEPKPENLVYGGYNDDSEGYGGYPLDLCRVAYKGGVHPGKLWKDMCHIGWGGKERYFKEYEVLTWNVSSGPTTLAKYTFEQAPSSEEGYPDDSAQANWVTSTLLDNATGTGAMNQSNLHPFNSTLRTGSTGQYLALSSNREGDKGIPTGDVGESTWFTFSIALMDKFDFSGQKATVDTYGFSGLGGTTSTNWTLYFSLDGGSSFTSLGTKEGQTANAKSGLVGPKTISWDLTPIGVQSGKIYFLLDPVSTGGTNGVINQRSTGFDNLIVKALPRL